MASTVMSRSAVLHYMGATQRSRSVVGSVIWDLRNNNHDVLVVDVGAFTTISQELPPDTVVRLFGHRIAKERWEEVLDDLGATLHVLRPGGTVLTTLPTQRYSECEQAIESELLTYFRQETLRNSSRAVKFMRAELTRQALSMYGALDRWLRENAPDELLIPNGRTSRQKAARICAEELGIPVRFYENGRAHKDSYYLGTTQPHDRIASQAEVASLTSSLSQEKISELATTWLSERMSETSGTNSFSRTWTTTEHQESRVSDKPRAVFFTSSADEFLAFGPMWNIDSWDTQFHAFDVMMAELETRGFELILRVHPNLVVKSRTYFLRTVEEIRDLQRKHPSLEVHWHTSARNSYDLAQSAEVVIAERSTIALEANLMGKPVWVNQAAQWDQVADIRQVLKPSDINPGVMDIWNVDTRGAERFVAYWMMQEKPLKYSWRDWASWDPENSPLSLKIARLWVKNPWFHRWHLIRLEWGTWRNKRFKR
jgi:hypothetical protein